MAVIFPGDLYDVTNAIFCQLIFNLEDFYYRCYKVDFDDELLIPKRNEIVSDDRNT